VTVVVAFHCTDGVVVVADSMLTPSIGGINIGHHSGVKCSVITGPQLFAFSGDQGQAARFRFFAETAVANLPATNPLLYVVNLSQQIVQQLSSTGIPPNNINVNAVLAFVQGGSCHCCVFEGFMQPRLLDAHHYYVALGSGKLSADPFLRFVSDTFCAAGQPPNVHLATFLAVWVVQHVINVNPGGVAGPIRVSVFERNAAGGYDAKELQPAEIAAHVTALDDAAEALRKWRNDIQSGAAAGGVAAPPAAPVAALAAPAGIPVAGNAPLIP
jgi:hypothetical protein